VNKKYGLSKRNLILSAFFLTGIALSLLSSVIIMSVGCGYFRLLDCGYWAGFPIPYARFNEKVLDIKDNQFLVNPTLYYKHKFSTERDNKIRARNSLSNGIVIPFFLLDITFYEVNVFLFLLNILVWLLPAGFIIGVFF